MIHVKIGIDSVTVAPAIGEDELQCVTRLREIHGHSAVVWDDEKPAPAAEAPAAPVEATPVADAAG
jgi:hypothetical protein